SLAVLACALAAHVPIKSIVEGIESFVPVAGRSKHDLLAVADRDIHLIDDTYNANPDSVRAAIDVLKTLPEPRLLVLGDMGEVGDQGPAFHEEIGQYARQCGIEELWTCGPLSEHTMRAFGRGKHFSDAQSLAGQLNKTVFQFNSTLIKGSRFMRMEQVVQKIHDLASQPLETPCS
ncbi:MAG: UDP-N-acetylmuramoyl-tripeptide--D-alanyl-D-alanine ligase, partial [Pseudomonadota bacterium]